MVYGRFCGGITRWWIRSARQSCWGGAWQGKRVRSESAMVALFNLLGSEPTLVLETERVGHDLSLRVGYWGLGQSGYCFYEVGRIPYDRIAASIAREGAKRWRSSREHLRAAGVSEEEITRYGGIAADNLRVLEAEEKQAAAGVPADQFAFYKISEADHGAAAKAVAACHCLIASCVTDVYHLVHYDTPPLLPKVLVELIPSLPMEWASSLVTEVVQSFCGSMRCWQEIARHGARNCYLTSPKAWWACRTLAWREIKFMHR